MCVEREMEGKTGKDKDRDRLRRESRGRGRDMMQTVVNKSSYNSQNLFVY
jgi:hypothetical protein